MLGTIVNAIAILAGGFLGAFLTKGLNDKYKITIMQALGMAVVVIGLGGTFGALGKLPDEDIILVIISLALGSLFGEFVDIEKGLDRLGSSLEGRFKGKGSFSKGFVTASLVYCVGSMAIMGALQSGLQGTHQILFAKSIIDGITAVVFASTLGIGVAFSAVPVFVYQGAITLGATLVEPLLKPEVVFQMSAVGGILIAGIGINILEIKRIKVGNMLPAIFVPVVYYIIRLFF